MTESKRFSREIKRISQNFAVRPNEVIKRNTNDGNLSLTFKSTDFDDKELLITDKSLLVNSTINKKHKSLIVDGAFQLDLNKIDLSIIKLEGDSTLTYVENFDEGKIYQIIVQQNEIGNNNFIIHENLLEHVVLLGDGISLNSEPNSLTIFNLTVANNNFFIEQENNLFKKVNNLGSIAFTIDTTLGDGLSTFTLPLKEQQNVYIYDPEYPDYHDSIEFGDYLNFDFVVDWGDGQSDHITSFNDLAKTHTYATNGIYSIKMIGLIEGFGITTNEYDWSYTTEDYEKIISVDEISYTGLKECDMMFNGCSNLTSFNNVSGDWCKNITNMWYIFGYCSSLETLDVSNWDVSNVTHMNSMFVYCTSLATLDVSNWDVSNVSKMQSIFFGCSSLTELDVSNWDVSNVSKMQSMFWNCISLTTIDVSNWDVSNVSDMYSMFNSCSSLTELDVSNWDVSNVSKMQSMFYACSSLTTLEVSNWDVSNVSDMSYMFYACYSLTTLDVSNWNVSNVTNMSLMFDDCLSLTTLDISNWDVSNVTNMYNMFDNTPLDTPSYDALLIGWSKLPSLKPNLTFRANLAEYSAGAAADARQYIIDTYGWTIQDGGQVV